MGSEFLFSGSQDGCLISWSVADLCHVKIIEVSKVLGFSSTCCYTARTISLSTVRWFLLCKQIVLMYNDLLCLQHAHNNVIAAMVCSDDYLVTSSYTNMKVSYMRMSTHVPCSNALIKV